MNQLSKKLKCIVIRGGIELWAEEERLKDLESFLKTLKSPTFVKYDDEIINTADITGIFSPQTMAEKTMRKNGQWQCKFGTWHDRFQKCECLSPEQIKAREENKIRHRELYGVDPI